MFYCMQSSEKSFCPGCGGSRLAHDPVRGETVCMDCGTIVQDRVEYIGFEKGRSWGSTSTELLFDRGVATVVG